MFKHLTQTQDCCVYQFIQSCTACSAGGQPHAIKVWVITSWNRSHNSIEFSNYSTINNDMLYFMLPAPLKAFYRRFQGCFARADSVGACLGPSEKRWQPCKTSGPENVWHVPILQDRALHSEGQEIPGHNKIYILLTIPCIPCILTFSSCPMQFRMFGFKTKEGGKLRKNALCTLYGFQLQHVGSLGFVPELPLARFWHELGVVQCLFMLFICVTSRFI